VTVTLTASPPGGYRLSGIQPPHLSEPGRAVRLLAYSRGERDVFAVSLDEGRVEWAGSRPGRRLFAQKRRTWPGGLLGHLQDIWLQPRDPAHDPGEAKTWRWARPDRGATASFRDWYLLPMAAAIWSCPTGRCSNTALHLRQFLPQPACSRFLDRPELADRARRAGVRPRPRPRHPDLRLDAGRLRQGHHSASCWRGRAHRALHGVVLACHSDRPWRFLGQDADWRSAATLARCATTEPRGAAHRRALLPVSGVWSAWNYRGGRGDPDRRPVTVSYLINRLRRCRSPAVIVSLNPFRGAGPAKVIASSTTPTRCSTRRPPVRRRAASFRAGATHWYWRRLDRLRIPRDGLRSALAWPEPGRAGAWQADERAAADMKRSDGCHRKRRCVRLGDARAALAGAQRFTTPFYLRLPLGRLEDGRSDVRRGPAPPISFRYRDHGERDGSHRWPGCAGAGPRGVAADGEVGAADHPRPVRFVSTRSASGLPRPLANLRRRPGEVNNTSASATTTWSRIRTAGRYSPAKRCERQGVPCLALLPGARRVPLPLDRRGRVARRRSTITRRPARPGHPLPAPSARSQAGQLAGRWRSSRDDAGVVARIHWQALRLWLRTCLSTQTRTNLWNRHAMNTNAQTLQSAQAFEARNRALGRPPAPLLEGLEGGRLNIALPSRDTRTLGSGAHAADMHVGDWAVFGEVLRRRHRPGGELHRRWRPDWPGC